MIFISQSANVAHLLAYNSYSMQLYGLIAATPPFFVEEIRKEYCHEIQDK
jgi:hypothetical protein